MAYPTGHGQANISGLTAALKRHAEETVTDEDVARILAPVLARIQSGAFDRTFFKRFGWLLPHVSSVTAVAVLIVAKIFS